jgi:hypothetical protein
MSTTTNSTTRLGARIEQFFFREERPVGLALVRILLPLVLLIPTLHRVFRVREFYTTSGSPTPIWNSYGQPDFLPIPSSPVAAGLYAVLIGALLCSSLGWRTRTSLLIAAVLNAYFGMIDMISTMTKYTVVATHILTLMSLSGCGRIWSVDRWLAMRRGQPWSELASAWPRRLIQLLIGIVYLGAAITKMHTPTFFTGDQLRFWLLTNINSANPLGEVLSQYPGMILVMAYFTIIWEVLFLFLCWKGVGRLCMLTLGLGFHIMTTMTLGLIVFPLIYFVLYLLWYEEPDHVKLLARWRGTSDEVPPAATGPTWRFPSLVAWTTCLASIAATGVLVDRYSDPFGDQRSEGRYTLQPISAERAQELLRNDERVAVVDKVFSLDIGSVMFNDNLVDRKTQFHHGEKARVQCSLLPPHEDLYMEIHLKNEEGAIMQRLWQVVARENLRGHFWFDLNESLPPGKYSIVIRVNGAEAGTRTLQLLPAAESAAASATPVATVINP